MKVENITQTESVEIRKLLFKSASSNFHDSWHQGFYFDNKIKYGIYQKDGGPCGILAAVQAFFLKHLLFVTQTKITDVNKDARENLVVAALSDILLNATSETGSKRVVIVIPS
jgi:ubiquitin carboxyl-terminal hydrolase MINDY-3/4